MVEIKCKKCGADLSDVKSLHDLDLDLPADSRDGRCPSCLYRFIIPARRAKPEPEPPGTEPPAPPELEPEPPAE